MKKGFAFDKGLKYLSISILWRHTDNMTRYTRKNTLCCRCGGTKRPILLVPTPKFYDSYRHQHDISNYAFDLGFKSQYEYRYLLMVLWYRYCQYRQYRLLFFAMSANLEGLILARTPQNLIWYCRYNIAISRYLKPYFWEWKCMVYDKRNKDLVTFNLFIR